MRGSSGRPFESTQQRRHSRPFLEGLELGRHNLLGLGLPFAIIETQRLEALGVADLGYSLVKGLPLVRLGGADEQTHAGPFERLE